MVWRRQLVKWGTALGDFCLPLGKWFEYPLKPWFGFKVLMPIWGTQKAIGPDLCASRSAAIAAPKVDSRIAPRSFGCKGNPCIKQSAIDPDHRGEPQAALGNGGTAVCLFRKNRIAQLILEQLWFAQREKRDTLKSWCEFTSTRKKFGTAS